MWVGELPTKVATIYALAFSPDNRTLYSGDTQGYVLAWDLLAHNYRVLFRRPFSHAHPGHRGVNWLWPTPDGRRLLIQDEHRLIDALHPEAGPILDPGPGYSGTFHFPPPVPTASLLRRRLRDDKFLGVFGGSITAATLIRRAATRPLLRHCPAERLEV